MDALFAEHRRDGAGCRQDARLSDSRIVKLFLRAVEAKLLYRNVDIDAVIQTARRIILFIEIFSHAGML